MIKVFTTPTCAYCHALLDWLDEMHIDYEEVDATSSPEAVRRNISAVPVTIITDEKGNETEIVGFDRPAIKKALKNLAA